MNKKFYLLAFLMLTGLTLAACTPVEQQAATDVLTNKNDEAMMEDDHADEAMMEDDSTKSDDAMMKDDDAMIKDDSAKGEEMMMKDEIKTFTVTGKNFEFNVEEIRVKKGDKVKINFTSESGFHDWVVDEFNAKTAQVLTGKSSSVEFIADKTGTFEYYCSVGAHRQQGMVGKLIVE